MNAHKNWSGADLQDMTGMTAVITGANSGLGYAAAQLLAAKGVHVVMACRSAVRGEEARGRIVSDHPKGDLRVAELDVADLASVRRFADAWLAHGGRIDLLINNAGVMAIPRQISVDGFEMQLAANHLGHFALTGLLMPILCKTAGSRVVAVSSIAARSGHIDFDDLMGERRYDPWRAYNQSKLANLMFAFELQRRLGNKGIGTVAVAAHPGASLTNLFATPGAAFAKRVLSPLMRFFFQPAEEGVLPILYAATARDAQPGGYYGPANWNEMKGPPVPAKIPKQALDQAIAARLWEVSEQLTGVAYP